ncbi:MAG TPA: glucosamine-6-phosphate deaminase [Chryseosolibacter sp.]|nr:glucosamine-6-phosphate deaminase [Chryseosolibacter sp.]
MDVRIFPSYDQLSEATAELVVEQVTSKPDSLLCFPSGDSPTGTLSLLVKYSREGKVDFSRCTFVGLDEWAGMDRTIPGSCQHYLYEHFFTPAAIRDHQIVFFDARSNYLSGECERITRYLDARGPLDMVIVGVGTNGHIGLNEPGTTAEKKAHVIDLAESTRQSAKKYFADTSVLRQGITLGLAQLMAARSLVMIASGEKKSSIVREALEGVITTEVPASYLQAHPRSFVFVDAAAASKLTIS